MKSIWQLGLLLGIVAQFCLAAQAAVIEETYSAPLEVVIESPDLYQQTIVRDNEIIEYQPETNSYEEYVPSATLRTLTDVEIKALSSLPVNGKGMQFPLAVPAWISSSFGYRIHPISGESRFHQGADIAAPEGAPVVAAWGGKVEIAGWLGGLGFAVVISHDNGARETRYGHLSQVLVEAGQEVKPGQPIGLVGSTGFSTGPHLHFELWEKDGEEWLVKDPTPILVMAMERLELYLAQVRSKNKA